MTKITSPFAARLNPVARMVAEGTFTATAKVSYAFTYAHIGEEVCVSELEALDSVPDFLASKLVDLQLTDWGKRMVNSRNN